MEGRTQSNLGLLVLAGVGAGTILGASIGLVLGRRAGREAEAAMQETVEDLKAKAQQVLSELSRSVAQLRSQSPPTQTPFQE